MGGGWFMIVVDWADCETTFMNSLRIVMMLSQSI